MDRKAFHAAIVSLGQEFSMEMVEATNAMLAPLVPVPDEAAVTESLERHAAQLHLYRRVVAVLTGLSPGEVRGEIVFTRRAERREVAMGAPAEAPRRAEPA